jgi:GT2 family glycosyltransferase
VKKLSIVILNYNSLNLINDCLKSFKKYSPRIDNEIIVVNNDNNNKDFDDFSRKYPEIRFIQNSGNWGFSNGCNLGASFANGEYLLFLNPDTQLNETPAIDRMVDALEKDESVGVCGCRTITEKGIGNEISWTSPWLLIRWIRAIHDIVNKSKNKKKFAEEKDIWYPGFVGGSAIVLNTQDFNNINGWSDDRYWMYCEDSDICYKIEKNLGKRSALVRDCSINHISGGASKVDDSSILMLKLEMVISTHNYIYQHSVGLSRITILSSYILKSLFPPFIKLSLSLLFFNKKRTNRYKYLTVGIIRYYLKSIKRRTWISDKLDVK